LEPRRSINDRRFAPPTGVEVSIVDSDSSLRGRLFVFIFVLMVVVDELNRESRDGARVFTIGVDAERIEKP
jgi:hypothetical protein